MRIIHSARLSTRHIKATRALHRYSTASCASRPTDYSIGSVFAYADGACRGNPGRSGCGALLLDPLTGRVLASDTKYIGDQESNNEAEYHGLMLALQLAQKHQATHVRVFMDSQLVVRQMQGLYRVKAANLRILHQQCKKLSAALPHVAFTQIAREENVAADRLANEAIDDYFAVVK